MKNAKWLVVVWDEVTEAVYYMRNRKSAKRVYKKAVHENYSAYMAKVKERSK